MKTVWTLAACFLSKYWSGLQQCTVGDHLQGCLWSEALCAVLTPDWLEYSHAAFWLAVNCYSPHGKFDFCVTFSVVLLILLEYFECSPSIKTKNIQYTSESRTTQNEVWHHRLRSGLIFCSLLLCRERLSRSSLNIHFLIISKRDVRCKSFCSHK